ncbi:uncharacterized protein LOC113054602 [Carassius auratus]|uniref:Uncharacterized protein LOC113054602 n=1 Tax=Carassius auratus TaxID=7957 RepID=A0A6P6KXF5_CARAU|nr:uncharacterized protein LOC113054602 [Carassius auratus]
MADRVSAFNRSVQFTPAENMCLLEEYNSYKDILLGKFSGGECSNKKKCLIWKKISATVNSINPTVERSVKDVQKRYKNMVQDAKKEIFKRKYPKTGGGPQEKLKDTTEMVMNIYGGQSPMFWGISGGRESGVCGAVNTDVTGGVPSATDSSTPLPHQEEEPDSQDENTVTLSLNWDRSEAVVEEPAERREGTGDEESESASASASASATATATAPGPMGCTTVFRGTTMSMVLDKQYRNLQLEERKLLLEIEVLQLQRDKLKLELHKQSLES